MDAGVYLKLLKSCVPDREIEEQPYNRKVRVRFPCPHIRHEYWCSSQEAESRDISISCMNLLLNRCKMNTCMFKLSKKSILVNQFRRALL